MFRFNGRNIKKRNDSKTYSEIVTTYHPAAGVDEVDGIYFNGINTIQKKTRYAIENKLAGIMIWEIGQDTFDDTSLLGAVNRSVTDTKLGNKNSAAQSASNNGVTAPPEP